jgi:hypothetical protein
MRLLPALLLLFLTHCTHRMQPMFSIPFESNPNQTLTYAEAIACYEKMAAAHPDMFGSRPSAAPTAATRCT